MRIPGNMICLWLVVASLCLAACSTTRNLPEGEVLYVGQKSMVIENMGTGALAQMAMEEVDAALATAPNNSFMGSSSIRTPFPVGLWFYNAFAGSEKGLGKWIFNHFASDPVLLSSVNPAVRVQAARNVLQEYGYFRNKVAYEVIEDKKDSLKAYLRYKVDFGIPYAIDNLEYRGFKDATMDIISGARNETMLPVGTQFNIVDLNGERERLSDLLRNSGRFYFRPEYITYQADTIQQEAGHVSMRMVPVEGIPEEAEKPFSVGKTTISFMGSQGEEPTDSLESRGYMIRYSGKLPVRARLLRRWIDYQNYRMRRWPGTASEAMARNLYSQHREERIEERLRQIGIFRYRDVDYVPRGGDALLTDTLDEHVSLIMDKPYNAELDFNARMKSNNQVGPGASFTLTKYNVWRGGETLTFGLNGSYEWQTGKNSSSDMNSYEVGANAQVTFPRVMLPKLHHMEFDFPATTTFNLYVDQLNRPKYYQMLAFGGNATYDFQPSEVIKHSFTLFRLTYTMLSKETEAFRRLQEETPALYQSIRDQFIPTVEYTVTYDNTVKKGVRNPLCWQTTVASAGNLVSGVGAIFGNKLSEPGKKLLGVPYAQYLKLVSELRYHQKLSEGKMIAYRALAGVVWSYGNSHAAPYAEQFYIGGPNSIRAYSARNVGPGGLIPDNDNKYSFINHVGDLKLEANVEFRFRMVNDLHGALFLDAGNVWLLRKDESRPGANISLRNILRNTAVGTGAGLRYDMDFLVLRVDLGVALHHPYDTGKKGYFNVPRLKDALALHFAIGYPF